MVQAELKRKLKFRVWNNKDYRFDPSSNLEVFKSSDNVLHHLCDEDQEYTTIQQWNRCCRY